MRIVTTVFLILFCFIVSQATAADRLWTYVGKDVIMSYRISPLGNIVVTTPDKVFALDPETGRAQWKREDLKVGDIGLAFMPMMPFGITKIKNEISAINLENGETIWDTHSLSFKTIYGYLPVPELNALLVFGEIGKKDKTVVLIDIISGEARWRQDDLFNKKPDFECYSELDDDYYSGGLFKQNRTMKRHQPVIVCDSGIVFYVSKDGLMKVNGETGELIWKVKELEGKKTPLVGKDHAHFVVDDNVIYVPYERKLIAVNLDDGSVVWNHKKKFKAHINQMQMSIEGLVIYGFKPAQHYTSPDGEEVNPACNYFMDVLMPNKGMSSWEKPLTDLDSPMPIFIDEDYAFVIRSEDIILVDLQTGSYNQFSHLKLKGKETPTHVERIGKNYLISSPQNMLMLKSRGGLRYHTYYKPPGATFVQKFLLVVGGTILDEIFDTENHMRYVYFDKDSLSRFGYSGGSFFMGAIDACKMKFKQTVEGKKYHYIYTGEPLGDQKGYSLVKIDKETGDEEGRIWIDKQFPDYIIDFATETVYARESNNKIFAIR